MSRSGLKEGLLQDAAGPDAGVPRAVWKASKGRPKAKALRRLLQKRFGPLIRRRARPPASRQHRRAGAVAGSRPVPTPSLAGNVCPVAQLKPFGAAPPNPIGAVAVRYGLRPQYTAPGRAQTSQPAQFYPLPRLPHPRGSQAAAGWFSRYSAKVARNPCGITAPATSRRPVGREPSTNGSPSTARRCCGALWLRRAESTAPLVVLGVASRFLLQMGEQHFVFLSTALLGIIAIDQAKTAQRRG